MKNYDRESDYWRDIEEAQEAQIRNKKDLAADVDQEQDRKSD